MTEASIESASQGKVSFWKKLFPVAGWLSSYQPKCLSADLIAGLTGAAVVVPQSMAYASIAGLPLVVGLYTAFVPLVVYAILGTSRPLSVTTTSTIAMLTASALHQIPVPLTDVLALSAEATLALTVGGILIVASLLRLGFIASLISDPVLTGFKAGVGLLIVVDQVPKLLGLHFNKGHFLHNIASIVDHLPQASVPTILLALAMLALQLGLQRFVPRAPASLVTVASGIAASGLAGLAQRGIELVGDVQGGLPSLSLPNVALFQHLWPAATGIALMSFVESVAAAQAFRNPDESRPEPNQELLAIGMANTIGGLFHNMPSGGGTSQTAVNRRTGACTQIAGLATAAVVVAVLFFLAPLVHLMPQATLAAVVVLPCARMIRPSEFRAILQIRAMEFSWAIVAFVGVVFLGTLNGILVGVVLSLLALIYHANRRPVFVIARKPNTDVFRPLSSQHPLDETFPGLLMVKTEGVINFANAQRIADQITPLVNALKPKVLVLDCSAISDFEYTALKMLIDAERKLSQTGISLWLAALNPEPLVLIERSALGKTLGRDRMLFNLEQAVERFQVQLSGSNAVS